MFGLIVFFMLYIGVGNVLLLMIVLVGSSVVDVIVMVLLVMLFRLSVVIDGYDIVGIIVGRFVSLVVFVVFVVFG